MNDDMRSLDQLCTDGRITDVAVHELVAGMCHHIVQVLTSSGVCELVECRHTPVGAGVERVANEVAPNETGAAGDKYLNHESELYHPARRRREVRGCPPLGMPSPTSAHRVAEGAEEIREGSEPREHEGEVDAAVRR